MEHYKFYLYGRKFIFRTNNAAIKLLKTFTKPTGQLARWLEKMSMFEFSIQHRPGKRHANADKLSRIQNENTYLAVFKDNYIKINWLQLQQNNPFLIRMINWVKTQTRPSAEETRTFDAKNRTLWARLEELGMINKSLSQLTETETGLGSLIIVFVYNVRR